MPRRFDLLFTLGLRRVYILIKKQEHKRTNESCTVESDPKNDLAYDV